MPVLSNRTVVPSHLGVEYTPPSYDGNVFDDVKLRVGEVQEVIYPDDKRSFSKRVTEYNVLVQYRANNTANLRLYTNCTTSNLFGGLADRFHWTLRAAHTDTASINKDTHVGLGSKVLLACINGETKNAVIVGGLRDPADKDASNGKDLGHHLELEFNGINLFVNKDGELSLAYKGSTTIKGKPVNTQPVKDVFGTAVTLEMDGSFRVVAGVNLPGDASQTFHIDPMNDLTQIQAHKDLNLLSRGNAALKAREHSVLVQSEKENVNLVAKQLVHITGQNNGVQLGRGTDPMILGQKHVDDLRTLCQTLIQQLTNLGVSLAIPQAAKPAGAQACVQMIVAVTQFMGKLNSHLSQHSSTD